MIQTDTLATRADLIGWTTVGARATVLGITAHIYATVAAVGLTRRTATVPIRTEGTLPAGMTTASTMEQTFLEVQAGGATTSVLT